MRNVVRNFLLLSFALLASAQVQKDCSAPPEYPNMKLNQKFSGRLKFSSGDKVRYDCAEDFTGRGNPAAHCAAGRWSRLTLECEKKSCGNAGELPNGEFQYEGNAVLGERVYAICNEGFTLKGFSFLICTRSGWSGELPSCVEGEATCSPPAVAHSVNSTGAVSVFRVGDHVTYTCSRGLQLDGAQKIACGPAGLWEPRPPRCLAPPEKEGKLCGSAGEILNGLFTYTGVEFGDSATAVCDEGHRLVGRATRHCLSKGWDGRVPACEAVVCEELPGATNAEMIELPEAPHTYRTVIRYQCRVGTLIGQRNIWCTKDGTWSDPAPRCKEITCPAPKVANAYWTGGHSLYKHRDTISIECKWGFARTGLGTVTCGGDGRWSPGLPKCALRRTYRRV